MHLHTVWGVSSWLSTAMRPPVADRAAGFAERYEEVTSNTNTVLYAAPRPLIVIATQHPVERGGTRDLPEASSSCRSASSDRWWSGWPGR